MSDPLADVCDNCRSPNVLDDSRLCADCFDPPGVRPEEWAELNPVGSRNYPDAASYAQMIRAQRRR